MSKTEVTISFWLPTQIVLLVLFYGGIMPNLPLWLVWLPSLLVIAFFVVIAVIIIVAVILGLIFG
jgi:hypothetical protein